MHLDSEAESIYWQYGFHQSLMHVNIFLLYTKLKANKCLTGSFMSIGCDNGECFVVTVIVIIV